MAFDFVPNGGSAPAGRDIASNESCNACHGKLTAHGSRDEMKNCVICHNPGVVDPESGNSVDMPVMTHKIHAAAYIYRECGDGMKVCGDAPY